VSKIAKIEDNIKNSITLWCKGFWERFEVNIEADIATYFQLFENYEKAV
jgi:hypothetical protein